MFGQNDEVVKAFGTNDEVINNATPASPPKSLFQKVITPLLPAETIRNKYPISAAIGAYAPIFSAMTGVPGAMGLKPNLLEQGSQEVANQTSPLAIAGNLMLPFMPEVKGALPKSIPGAIISSSAKGYEEALGATTKAERALAEKVVPGLVENKPFAFTRSGLLTKATRAKNAAGEALDTAYSSLPEDQLVKIKPILENIDSHIKDLHINGVLPEENTSALNFLNQAKENLIKFTSGEDVSPSIIRQYRQVIDKQLAASKRGFSMTGRGGARLDAQNAMANSIRRELANQFPSIGELNKNFSFWKNTTDLLESTVNKGAKPGIDIIAGIGQLAGDATGGGAGIVLKNLGRLLSENVALKTFSASMKSRLAEYMSKGNYAAANQIVTGVMKREMPAIKPEPMPPQLTYNPLNPTPGVGVPVGYNMERDFIKIANRAKSLADTLPYLRRQGMVNEAAATEREVRRLLQVVNDMQKQATATSQVMTPAERAMQGFPLQRGKQ